MFQLEPQDLNSTPRLERYLASGFLKRIKNVIRHKLI